MKCQAYYFWILNSSIVLFETEDFKIFNFQHANFSKFHLECRNLIHFHSRFQCNQCLLRLNLIEKVFSQAWTCHSSGNNWVSRWNTSSLLDYCMEHYCVPTMAETFQIVIIQNMVNGCINSTKALQFAMQISWIGYLNIYRLRYAE